MTARAVALAVAALVAWSFPLAALANRPGSASLGLYLFASWGAVVAAAALLAARRR